MSGALFMMYMNNVSREVEMERFVLAGLIEI